MVGAGSAGCTLADALTRDATRSVLLLEQGPGWPDDAVRSLRRLPIGPGEPHATPISEASGLPVVRGRGLGGSSAVNGAYFLRWHRDDFDGWPAGWDLDTVEAAYTELDGPGGRMSASPFGDDELGDTAIAFESFWRTRVAVRAPADRWPIVGVNRVISNRRHGLRMTSAEAFLRPAIGRPDLTVRTGVTVGEVLIVGGRVTGVRTDTGDIASGEVILCAGTLGTAGILLRSAGLSIPGVLGVGEHREVQVGYRRRRAETAAALPALLQSVVHTEDGFEIRCYSDDFGRYIGGASDGRPVIGVCGMRPAGTGRVVLDDAGAVRLHLEEPEPAVLQTLSAVAVDVRDMLASSEFTDVVEPGSITVDPRVGTSQHAWGTMPMGVATDGSGVVGGVRGLRIVDGSILPGAGRSGPHATTMMVAYRVGETLA
ncbi:mycofactocin system GMC family oxidoreductase MftG [Gordonia sp. NPDC003376]